MEDCSVALVTARESFVGRLEHCFCGRQLPRGREEGGRREGGRMREGGRVREGGREGGIQ